MEKNALRNIQDNHQVHTFPNGIRLIHKQVKSTSIAHCGIMFNIGSRDEKPHQQGIAHFWEHMAFKGTKKRKSYHILNSLDSVGGELNAYTTKEKICFYASALVQHFPKMADLVSDISFGSVFPEKEIIKEKGVILEEMAMYQDDPADAITDEFDELVFGDHPLGKNILGNRESVSGFQQADFYEFINENLNTHEVVFASVSNLPFEKVLRVVSKYLEDVPEATGQKSREDFTGYKPENRIVKKSGINQAHCIYGTESLPIFHDDRVPFFLLTNILGGPAMNSRLILSIREKYGLVYDISANLINYLDTGAFYVNFATETKSVKRCLELVEREIQKLRSKKLGTRQLYMAKQQLMGQVAMGEESNLSLMLGIAKSYLDRGYMQSIDTLFDEIEEVTAEKIQEITNTILAKDRFSTLIYMPEEEK
ncbi:M16 family metallopeptidase [Sediminitomix flava]|uniref:Putative Zn-dependent peptidase n=1 Tax=Sediminitomix flava TaxID=379075 RepID=A0A315Z6S1_SEDFL|nr:pitrilysin family protein [Sediminitomix flava]PWJ40073.1 putative Zn-dependent peptidase [Sediminitomix flava]